MAARIVITGRSMPAMRRTNTNSQGANKRPTKKAPPTLAVKALCSTHFAINLDAGTQTEKSVAVTKKTMPVSTPAAPRRTRTRIAAKTQALAVNRP